jgi:O-methyltransferase involved in polyketide biosynthesis
MKPVNISNRNFNTISISAKSLILMKGYTDIPYARKTAELITFPDCYMPDYTKKSMTFWKRLAHFEKRYWSIDALLNNLRIHNILELSSGYSFRGLAVAEKSEIHYIDTDLPAIIKTKSDFISALKDDTVSMAGKLELLPLNALDEQEFSKIADRFPEGEIAIINEGLLMYLNNSEKKKLCRIIRNILIKRGGCWITGDIYLKNKNKIFDPGIDDGQNVKEFMETHHIENNKFESFSEAKKFFASMGFTLEKEAKVNMKKLSSMKYLVRHSDIRYLTRLFRPVKIQATWRLRVSDGYNM